jgi:hypothetical protein
VTGLHEFLAARYHEARTREEGKWTVRDCPFEWEYRRDFDGEYVEAGRVRIEVEAFVEQYGVSAADPAVLADIDAKEGLLALHAPDSWHGASAHVGCKECGQGYEVHEWGPKYPCATVRLLGLPFASHPDYREEWKP